MKRKREEDLSGLEIWQSVDTWADHTPVWAKKKEPYKNPWEVKSFGGSVEEITGKPVFPRKKILGKKPRRWCELLLFYLIFYSVLFSFSIALYHIFYYGFIVPNIKPMYLDIINRSVGLTVYPRMQDGDASKNNGHPLEYIEFNKSGNPEMESFLNKYLNTNTSGVDCSFTNPQPQGKSCNFNIDQLEGCGPPFKSECIYLRVTRTIERVPQGFKTEDELPNKFPEELKTIFTSIPAEERKRIWVRCHEIKNDRIIGQLNSLEYFPSHSSFPGYYFPFTRQPDYQDPLVAVKIDMEGMIMLMCKAWDKGVDPSNNHDASISFIFKTA